jgi:hypothetical protein
MDIAIAWRFVRKADSRPPPISEKLAHRSIDYADRHLDNLARGRWRFDKQHQAYDRIAVALFNSQRHGIGMQLSILNPDFDPLANGGLIANE